MPEQRPRAPPLLVKSVGLVGCAFAIFIMGALTFRTDEEGDSRTYDLLDSTLDGSCPMFGYTGSRWGSAACFCSKARNPNCVEPNACHCGEGCDAKKSGLNVSNYTVTFFTAANVWGCSDRSHRQRILTIPRSYFSSIYDLIGKCGTNGTKSLLATMMIDGFNRYQDLHPNVSVRHCMHRVGQSVHWLHLHTFCDGGHADGMPNWHNSLCSRMVDYSDAEDIANNWANQVHR